MTFQVETTRLGPRSSLARCKKAEIHLDTKVADNPNSSNPAGLLLAALSTFIGKGIERIIMPILQFDLRSVEVRVDVPPRIESIRYEIIVDTDEPDRGLELLHDNAQNFGIEFNTVTLGTQLSGVLRCKR